MDQFRRIAIHHPPGIAIWGDILKGVFQFARPDFPWLITANFENDLACIAAWNPDAVIAQCTSAEEEEFFSDLEVPVVNIARERSKIAFPSIQIDDFAVGVMAAEYYCDRGYSSLACYSISNREFMQVRVDGFVEAANQRNCQLATYTDEHFTNTRNLRPPGTQLCEWLKNLPPRTGVFAGTDILGISVASACRFIDRNVPDEIAILGVSNNELICNMEYPALSSIRLPGQRLGFEAAKKVHQMLEGGSISPNILRLRPVEVVSRRSSDFFCVDDKEVAAALEYIDNNFQEPINVASIVANVEISRSSLERKFRKMLGRSILQHLTDQRITAAKRLLVTSSMPLNCVSQSTGFATAKQFSAVFKKQTGEKPSSFRDRQTLPEPSE